MKILQMQEHCSCVANVSDGPKCDFSGRLAWQEEFWPTTAAEYVLHLLWTLSKRALWLSDAEFRQSYVAAVPRVSRHATMHCIHNHRINFGLLAPVLVSALALVLALAGGRSRLYVCTP